MPDPVPGPASMPLPAHESKHLLLLEYPFPPSSSTFFLSQLVDGQSNGTALWLGAQCLSLYLAHINHSLVSKCSGSPRVIELGSGIGLTACASYQVLHRYRSYFNHSLALSSLGWEVLATDIPPVISAVLVKNVQNNSLPSSGPIQIRELDWTIPPDDWTWNDSNVVSSRSSTSFLSNSSNLLNPPYDLICTSDTVYVPSLVQPLLRTLHSLCKLSVIRSPPVYLCIERRDPSLVDHLLSEARSTWGFLVVRIPHKKLAKAMQKGGVTWAKEEWDGIEIWKMTLPRE